jgi:hypothetical protein
MLLPGLGRVQLGDHDEHGRVFPAKRLTPKKPATASR